VAGMAAIGEPAEHTPAFRSPFPLARGPPENDP
jgi:hypothetical protein